MNAIFSPLTFWYFSWRFSMLLRIVCVHGFQPSLSWKDSKSNSLIVRDDNKFPKISVPMRHANFVIAFARITDSWYNRAVKWFSNRQPNCERNLFVNRLFSDGTSIVRHHLGIESILAFKMRLNWGLDYPQYTWTTKPRTPKPRQDMTRHHHRQKRRQLSW